MNRMAVDVETRGFTKKFVMGSCCWRTRQGNYKWKTFYKRKEMRNFIIESGEKQRKQGRKLYVYATNLLFDIFRIFNRTEKEDRNHLKRLSTKIDFFGWGKDYGLPTENIWIYFSDTENLMKGGVKQVGKILGLKKGELHPKLKIEKDIKITEEEMKQITDYNKQDTYITLKVVEYVEKNLKREGITVRKLLTAPGIGQKMLNKRIMQDQELRNQIMDFQKPDKENGINGGFRYKKQQYGEQIRPAYLMVKIDCFSTGKHQGVTGIDCNSLFPYCAMQLPFPKLTSEKKIENPLNNGWDTKTLFSQIGVSKCIIELPKLNIGILPIRGKYKEHLYPTEGTAMGIWGHEALAKAIELGGKIKAIEWSITYGQINKNPLADFLKELYQKRQNDPANSSFYKLIMNSLIGRFGYMQDVFEETEIDTEDEKAIIVKEKDEKLKEKGYKVVSLKDGKWLYRKDLGQRENPYYAVIVPIMILDRARIFMWEELNKIPKEDLLYTAVDSIIFKGNHMNKFNMNNELGGWKYMKTSDGKPAINVDCEFYTKGMYTFGGEIRIVGVGKAFHNIKEIKEQEKVKYKKMLTDRTASTYEEEGKFIKRELDLSKIRNKFNEKKEILEVENKFIDKLCDPEWFVLNNLWE